jgi:DNA-binding transcriptional LysR family regulator
MKLDSDLMRCFVAVAERENFTHAASVLGRTQSAVSVQIKRLEELVGEPVFLRGPRGVTLTQAGETLLVNARRIVSLLNETEASFGAPLLKGQLRIGLPEEYGSNVASHALALFGRVHKDVELSVRSACSGVQKQALEDGELDLAVVFDWERSLQGEVLASDPTVWATSDTHRLHEHTPIPIAVFDHGSWSQDYAIKSLQRRKHRYRIAYRGDTGAALNLAVSAGLAIAPLSRSKIPEGCRELTAAEGFDQIDMTNIVLCRGNDAGGELVSAMEHAMRAAFRSQPS